MSERMLCEESCKTLILASSSKAYELFSKGSLLVTSNDELALMESMTGCGGTSSLCEMEGL